ncbi:MAG TPA: primosomal protein N' [Polyangiaceae bacterium]|nr:primosomal protein N' [Polyangiaceae bacterium]
MLLARVALPVPLGQVFTYQVSAALAAGVKRGARVLCELGKRKVLGVVLEASERAPEIAVERLKPVLGVVDPEPVLPEELLGFLQELGRYYVAPMGEVMELALPAVERSAALTLEAASVKAVGRLVQVASAVPDAPVPKLRGRAPAILEHLKAHGPTELTALEAEWPSARAAVARLVEAGAVTLEKREEAVDPFTVNVPADVPPKLTPAQENAVGAIILRLERSEKRAFLLEGVTASGKTEVYLRAAARCLELGRGVIVLVPEIALTPQLVARFRARLGSRIAVLHSGLGERERHAMWRSLRSGEVRIAVGARSALFAPVQNLGLVVVDEEHDGSFKQEEGVRYHARDMALLRAHRADAVCVLGSATPSVTSAELAESGRLELVELPARARAESALPEAEIVDLRRIGPGPGGERLLSVPLFRALEETIAAREQAILFLNRRGFSPSVVCEACGKIGECPNCAVALTLHRARREALICHYCDHHEARRTKCPHCGEEALVEEGAGTERIESVLAEILPGARIARLDRDVAAGQKSERILDRVRKGEVDVLVGTQMVTKGHDLPNVTLVGVLNADAALSLPDYRAAERTFQLLVQVAGRAGRGGKPGRVLIQTRQPEHPAITLAVTHDVKSFTRYELAQRRELDYPPYTRLALVRFEAADDALTQREALRFAKIAKHWAESDVEVLGPAPAPLARLRGRYRHRFMLRTKDRTRLHIVLLGLARTAVDRRVRMAIDVDPVSML